MGDDSFEQAALPAVEHGKKAIPGHRSNSVKLENLSLSAERFLEGL